MRRLLKPESVLSCLRQCGVALAIAGVIHGFLGVGPASDAFFIGALGVLFASLGCINPDR